MYLSGPATRPSQWRTFKAWTGLSPLRNPDQSNDLALEAYMELVQRCYHFVDRDMILVLFALTLSACDHYHKDTRLESSRIAWRPLWPAGTAVQQAPDVRPELNFGEALPKVGGLDIKIFADGLSLRADEWITNRPDWRMVARMYVNNSPVMEGVQSGELRPIFGGTESRVHQIDVLVNWSWMIGAPIKRGDRITVQVLYSPAGYRLLKSPGCSPPPLEDSESKALLSRPITYVVGLGKGQLQSRSAPRLQAGGADVELNSNGCVSRGSRRLTHSGGSG
jgi:hypothetical protein